MSRVFLLVKFFGNKDHADEFVRGSVFCNRLSRFREGESDDATGRIDKHEGTNIWLQPENARLQLNGFDMSDDLAGPIAIQMNWLNQLHLFCLHAAHSGDLDLENPTGRTVDALRREMLIPEACFALGEHAVVIRDVPEFIRRMHLAAQVQGYRIAKGLVRYYDPDTFHGHFREVESVFWKQAEYSYQREFRFLIDTRMPGGGPLRLEIGDISDITLQLRSSELNGEKLLGGKLELARSDTAESLTE